VVVVLGSVALVLRLEQGRGPSGAETPTPSPAPTAMVRSSPRAAPVGAPAALSSPLVGEIGHRLLGVTAGWELFARGPREVVRIEPALGRITRTPVPALASSGVVAFIAGPDRVLVRPWDGAPGYVVPDGSPAKGLPAGLAEGGAVVPGPDQSHLWVESRDGGVLSLVGLNGRKTGPSIRLPATSHWGVMPDATGYVVVRAVGGEYDARPDVVHRVTTGTVVAVGPTRWLAVDCDDRDRCLNVVVDRQDGTRRGLAGALYDPTVPAGRIAPDGSIAAIYRRHYLTDGSSALSVALLDLASGTERALTMSVSPDGSDGSMVWSPDSRWLFVVGDRQFAAVDAQTRDIRDLGFALGPIEQLTVRPAS
jgi:hypothetical protein